MNVKTEVADDATAFATEYLHGLESTLTEWAGLYDETAYCALAEDIADEEPLATEENS